MSTAKKKTDLKAVKGEEVVTETKAVATKSASEVAAAANQVATDWGVGNITQKDIVIPKILAMQAMSKLVVNGDAKLGEFRESLNGAIVGHAETGKGDGKPLEFVPFFLEKIWIVFEDKSGTGKEYKFVKTEKLTVENENWPYEETINGVLIKRDRTMNFYVLKPSEIAQGSAIPYILSFRRTSAKAGQKLATTMFMKNLKAGKTPASMVMELTGTKTSNDKGTFVVLDVKEKRPSSETEIAEAFGWVQTIKAGTAKVDNSDLSAEAGEVTSSTGESSEF